MSEKAFTFICGDDDYLVSELGNEWFAKQSQGTMDDLSKEVVDGRAGNVADVQEIIRRFSSAVQTLSLFGDKKIVVKIRELKLYLKIHKQLSQL